MKEEFLHSLTSSFYLWLESVLAFELEAIYKDTEIKFKEVNPPRFAPSEYRELQGSDRQVSAEYEIDGALSGIMFGQNFVPIQNDSGIFFDYENARLFVPKSINTSAELISGKFPVKEVNTYISYDSEEELVIHGDFLDKESDENWLFNNLEKLPNNAYMLPCCIVLFDSQKNKQFALGGLMSTQTKIKVVVIGKNNFQVGGVLSRLSDTAHTNFPLIELSEFPYDQNSVLKYFPYSYKQFDGLSRKCVKIDNVDTYRIKNEIQNSGGKTSLIVGFADFDLSVIRFPRL